MSFRDDLYFRHAYDELNSVLILKSLMACVQLIRETTTKSERRQVFALKLIMLFTRKK